MNCQNIGVRGFKKMTIRLLTLSIGLLLVSSVHVTAQDREDTSLDVELKEILTLGDDESAPVEYLFGEIAGVRTDSAGNIFVADNKMMNIRVYDSEGDYLRTIGSRGRGPGEFQDITSMHIDRKNRLVVTDNLNSRFTWLSLTGEVLDTRLYNRNELVWPKQIGHPSGKEYLLLFEKIDLLHTMPSTPGGDRLEAPLTSFGPISLFPSSDEPYVLPSASYNPGQFWLTAPDEFVYAPGLYDGRLFRFKRKGSGWTIADTLSGWSPERGAFTPTEKSAGDDRIHFIHSGSETVSAVVHTQSVGCFVQNSGHIVHFLIARREDGVVFGVQVFSPAGKYQGFDVLERIDESHIYPSTHRLEMMWMDDRGRFYLKDRREVPVLRVVELSFPDIE